MEDGSWEAANERANPGWIERESFGRLKQLNGLEACYMVPNSWTTILSHSLQWRSFKCSESSRTVFPMVFQVRGKEWGYFIGRCERWCFLIVRYSGKARAGDEDGKRHCCLSRVSWVQDTPLGLCWGKCLCSAGSLVSRESWSKATNPPCSSQPLK